MKTLKQLTEEIILERLKVCKGNRTVAAKSLGLSIRGFRMMLARAGVKKLKQNPLTIKKILEDTGYENPTAEERDDWYNRDRF